MLPRGSRCGQHLSRPEYTSRPIVTFAPQCAAGPRSMSGTIAGWISYDFEARSTSPNDEKGRGMGCRLQCGIILQCEQFDKTRALESSWVSPLKQVAKCSARLDIPPTATAASRRAASVRSLSGMVRDDLTDDATGARACREAVRRLRWRHSAGVRRCDCRVTGNGSFRRVLMVRETPTLIGVAFPAFDLFAGE
jgi:hypothetical protein